MFKDHDRLFRHSFLLMAATQIGNLANLLFQMAMGRALPTEEYGALAAMLGIALIVSTPMDAMRAAMAQFASRLKRQGLSAHAPGLASEWMLKMLPWSAAAVIAGFIFNGPISAFFHVQSPFLIPMTGVSVGLALLFPLFIGALQGIEAFVLMSIAVHSYSVVRLLTGAAAVAILPKTASIALSGQLLGMAACTLIGWTLLRKAAGPGYAARHKTAGVPAYFLRSLATLSLFAALMNADTLLAKRFFAPIDAGQWAMAATIARTVVFLPMPIAMALFPKVTSWDTPGISGMSTLLKAVGLTALVVGAAVAACSLLPWLPLAIIYGIREPGAELQALVRHVLLAMSPLGLVYVLLNFELAQNRFRACMMLALPVALYFAAAAMRHETFGQLALALGCASFLALVLMLGAVAVAARRRPADGNIEAGVASL